MDVESHVAGLIDREIYKRAMEGKVVFQKKNDRGEVVEERIDHDNKLLLTLARNVGRRVDPSAWAPEDKRVVVENNSRTLNVSMDVDRLLEEMPTEAIRAMLNAVEKTKALPAPEPMDEEDDVEDAEVVPAPSSLDNGTIAR